MRAWIVRDIRQREAHFALNVEEETLRNIAENTEVKSLNFSKAFAKPLLYRARLS